MGMKADQEISLDFEGLLSYLRSKTRVFMDVDGHEYYLTHTDGYWRVQDCEQLNEKGRFVDCSELVTTFPSWSSFPGSTARACTTSPRGPRSSSPSRKAGCIPAPSPLRLRSPLRSSSRRSLRRSNRTPREQSIAPAGVAVGGPFLLSGFPERSGSARLRARSIFRPFFRTPVSRWSPPRRVPPVGRSTQIETLVDAQDVRLFR